MRIETGKRAGRPSMKQETINRLIFQGRAGSTPAIAVENAGHAYARARATTLAGLAATLEAANPTGPVVLLIGEVCERADVRSDQPVEVSSQPRIAPP